MEDCTGYKRAANRVDAENIITYSINVEDFVYIYTHKIFNIYIQYIEIHTHAIYFHSIAFS